MIKINLRPNFNSIESTADPEAQAVDSEIQRKGLVHIIVILLLPIGLYVYESQAKPSKLRQISTMNAQIEELAAFNQKQAAIVLEIQQIEKDEKEVEGRIGALNNLTLGRTVEIQILDLFQSIIREKMWLKLIEISESKLSIEGMAQSEMDVSIFLEELTRNTLLRDVRLLESNQELYEGQNFSRFKITAMLEKTK